MMNEAASNPEIEAVPASEDALPRSPQESRAMVPVSLPSSTRAEKVSFWRRIASSRSARHGPETEALTARIEALASQLAQAEQSIAARTEALERRLGEVWQLEEQIGHLLEVEKKLDALEEEQKTLVVIARTTNRLVVALTILAASGAALVAVIAFGGAS